MCVCVRACVYVRERARLSALRTAEQFITIDGAEDLNNIERHVTIFTKISQKERTLKTHSFLTRTYSYLTRLIFIRAKNVSNESCTKQARQWMYKRNEVRSRKHCCRGNAITITYCEWVSLALAAQHAKRMRPIIFSFVACLELPYFSTLSYKEHDFGGKKLWNINFVFWFSLQILSETFLILRRIQRDINTNYVLFI